MVGFTMLGTLGFLLAQSTELVGMGYFGGTLHGASDSTWGLAAHEVATTPTACEGTASASGPR